MDGYKRQDIEAKRNIHKEKYVDVDWSSNRINKNEYCPLCGCKYYVVLEENNDIRCNITIDRLDNDKSHEKENRHGGLITVTVN